MESNHPSRICNPRHPNADKDLEQHRVAPRRVLVAGLHRPSAERMRREFGERLDLRFYDDEENVARLHGLSAKVDVIVAMTKFISHKHRDVMVLSAATYIEISGGLTKLRAELERQVELS